MSSVTNQTGVVDAPFSTGDLAQRLAKQRNEAGQNNQAAETDSNATGANEGGAEGAGDTTDETVLATDATGTGEGEAAGEAGAEGAEVQAEVTGEEGAEVAPDAAAGAESEETVNLDQVPKLTKEQKQHVGEVFKQRLGEFKRKTLEEAEAKVNTEKTAREAAEARAQQLETELAQKPQAMTASAENPLANVTSAAELNKAVGEAQSVKTWVTQLLRRLDRNPDQVRSQLEEMQVKLPGGEFTPEAMSDWLYDAQDRAEQTISVHAPQRHAFLQQEAQFNAKAEQDFPWLKDPKSPKYADAMQAAKAVPGLRGMPHWKVAAAIYAEGLEVVRARIAATKPGSNANGVKPTIKKPVPPRISTRPTGSAPVAEPGQKTVTDADKKFQQTGSVNDLALTFASRRK